MNCPPRRKSAQNCQSQRKSCTKIIASRDEIKKIMDGKSDRKLIIVGPCSIHEVDAAIDYAKRLKELSDKVSDKLMLVMRVYFEKPRTTLGWKGLVYDPEINDSYNIPKGLRIGRKPFTGYRGPRVTYRYRDA